MSGGRSEGNARRTNGPTEPPKLDEGTESTPLTKEGTAMSVPRPAQPSMGPYAIVPAWVLASPLTHAQLAVYVALRVHCDRDRRAWPSQELLAQEARADERTVRRALTKFQELGLLTAERVRGFGTGSRMLYTLNDLPLPDTGVLQLPDTGVLQEAPTGHQRPIATGHSEQGYRTPVTELPDTGVLQKGTVPRTAPEQLSRVPAREAPPDLPASGSAAPEDDQPVSSPERDARRTPPLPAGTATRQTPTLWVTPRDWRPAPEFNPEVARRGLAAARAALQAARPVPPNSSEAEE